MPIKLTKKAIDRLPATEMEKGKNYYDEELRGFGITVYPSGRKVFFIQYGPTERRRRMTIGAYGLLTPEEARIMARTRLVDVLKGGDPLEDKKDKRSIQLLRDWINEYYEQVKLRKKHPKEDKRYLGWADKEWGNWPLNTITAEDISRKYHEIAATGKRTAANRFHASLSACMQTAWRLGKIEFNPVLRVEKLPENQPRNRVMSDAELTKMLRAIDELPEPPLRVAFLLLIHTGARRSEVLKARWEDFDFEAKVWRLPSTKSGRVQYIPLTADLVDMLQSLPRTDAFIIPGSSPNKGRFDLKRPWESLQQETGLTDLHIHDLRRSFGLAIARQAGIHVASRLLRHSNVSITAAVYAPLGLDELREALEKREKGIVQSPKEPKEA